jgi:hypothetical protein
MKEFLLLLIYFLIDFGENHVWSSSMLICTGLFEMIFRGFNNLPYSFSRCNPHVLSFYGVSQGSGLCSSSSRKYPGTEDTNQNRHWNHQRWHATNIIFFNVLLTVHLSTFVFVINKLDEQNFLFYSKFISCLYMFRAHVLIIKRSKIAV